MILNSDESGFQLYAKCKFKYILVQPEYKGQNDESGFQPYTNAKTNFRCKCYLSWNDT